MTGNLIALTGAIGSGKTTAADTLRRYAGYEIVKFAGPLKAMLAAIGLTDAHLEGDLKQKPCDLLMGATPRHAMQTLGTEWGRECIHEDVWLHLWRKKATDLLSKGINVVVDDCRFENELALVRALGGRRVNLTRIPPAVYISEAALTDEDKEALRNLGPGKALPVSPGAPLPIIHASENGLPLLYGDLLIENPMTGIAAFEKLILDRLELDHDWTEQRARFGES